MAVHAHQGVRARPFGRWLVIWLVAGIALPLLVLGAIQAAIFVRARNEIGRARALEAATSIAARIDTDLDMHLRAVRMFTSETTAGALSDTPSLNGRLSRHHALYGGFLTMLVADRAGNVVARHPLPVVDSRTLPALSVADRAYFQQPRKTLEPYLSGVFRGRGFGTDVIVAVSAPVVTPGGEFAGITEGSLNLSRQRRFADESLRLEGTKVLAIDPSGLVVFSGGTQASPALSSAAEWLAESQAGAVVYRKIEGEQHLIARAQTKNGWTVIVARPLRIVHAAALWASLLGVVAVALALTVSVLAARMLTARATRPLVESELRYRELVDRSLGLICVHDRSGILLDTNPAAAEALGWTRGELIGRSLLEFMTPEAAQDFAGYLQEIEATGQLEGLMQLMDRAGNRRIWKYRNLWVEEEDGKAYVLGHATDITERWHSERTFQQQASTDPLTGLANRSLFEMRLQQAVGHAGRHGSSGLPQELVGILFIDLDEFKEVNDGQGHDAGDEVLREVARRLRTSVRRTDTVARLGGDEFALIVEGIDSSDRARSLAQSVLEALARPYSYRDRTFQLTASVGLSLYPIHGVTPDALRERADEAMYEAKRSGKNQCRVASVPASDSAVPA